MDTFNYFANAFGFKVHEIKESLKSWSQKKLNEGFICGIWDNEEFKIICNPETSKQKLKRWMDAGYELKEEIVVPEIKMLWQMFDYFSEGDLNFIASKNGIVEFPKIGFELQEKIQECVQNQSTNKNANESLVKDYTPEINDNAFLMNLYGKLLSFSEKFTDAGKIFRMSAELMHAFAEPYSNLGTLLWKFGNQSDAFKLFTEALLKNPYQASAQLNFFDAGYTLKEYESMIRVMENIISRDEGFIEFQHHLAICYHRLDKSDQSLEILSQLLKEFPDDQEAQKLMEEIKLDSARA